MKQTIKTFLLGVLCTATCYALSSCNNNASTGHDHSHSEEVHDHAHHDHDGHSHEGHDHHTTTTPMKGTAMRATTTAIRMREATPVPMR